MAQISTFIVLGLVAAASAGYIGSYGHEDYVQLLLLISTFIVLGLVAAASAGYIGSYGHEDYNHYPEYKFEYSVHDPHTHDIKSQHETRHGNVVKGFYKLKEADGTIREVHYTADPKNGFNAKVHRSGQASHPEHYKSSSETFYGQGGYGHGGYGYGGYGSGGYGHAYSSNNNNLYSYGSDGYSYGGYGHGHAYSTNNNNLYSHGYGYPSGLYGGYGHGHATSSAYFKSH